MQKPPSIKQLQQKADNTAKIYNKSKNVIENARKKGFTDIIETPNGGISFKSTDYIYKLDNGKEAIHTIKATGVRKNDFKKVNEVFGFENTPEGYTWHHLDDYNVATGELTLELVRSDVHNALKPHSGGCAQYNAVNPKPYK